MFVKVNKLKNDSGIKTNILLNSMLCSKKKVSLVMVLYLTFCAKLFHDDTFLRYYMTFYLKLGFLTRAMRKKVNMLILKPIVWLLGGQNNRKTLECYVIMQQHHHNWPQR